MATVSEALEIALAHQQAGRLAQAEQICRQIVAVEPNHADGWHLLGVISLSKGETERAIDSLRRAVAANPNDAETHNNLGIAFKRVRVTWTRQSAGGTCSTGLQVLIEGPAAVAKRAAATETL
jgi:tetratricopeptide (TPR) repeat protein